MTAAGRKKLLSLGQDVRSSFLRRGDHKKILSDRARRRDFIVLGFIVLAILVILFISGTLDVAELLTGFLIFTFAAIAYFLSTEPGGRGVGAARGGDGTKTDARDSLRSAPRTEQDLMTDLQSVLSAYPEPALICGTDGRVLFHNALAAEVLRLPRSGLGISPSIIRRPDILTELDRIEDGLPANPLEIEVAGTPDQYFRVSMQAIELGGRPWVLIALDELTELRRAEKARADFLANASHELRTPLTSLAGFIETMRGPAKDDPAAWDRFLEIMYGQTERMRRLIHDLLSLSRIELNEHRRPDQAVNLANVVGESVEALVPIAKEKGIELEFISSTDAAPVHGVRDELVQVMQNLIDNALKYTKPGSGIRVEISSDLDLEQARTFAGRRWASAARISIVQSRTQPNDRFAVIRVSDEGEGIGRQHLPRLGERFYRVDEGRDRIVGGTGLGLAIVKHIVARHRGGLMVESEEGHGSAFGIWLPIVGQGAAAQPKLEGATDMDHPAA
tara:strand:- start:205 stop:1719 length:1515 start_codon:yes stop_codon:yes gene_type:complete